MINFKQFLEVVRIQQDIVDNILQDARTGNFSVSNLTQKYNLRSKSVNRILKNNLSEEELIKVKDMNKKRRSERMTKQNLRIHSNLSSEKRLAWNSNIKQGMVNMPQEDKNLRSERIKKATAERNYMNSIKGKELSQDEKFILIDRIKQNIKQYVPDFDWKWLNSLSKEEQNKVLLSIYRRLEEE